MKMTIVKGFQMSPIYDSRFSQTKREDALQLEREASKQSSRFEYIKPLAILGITFPISLILVANSGGWEQDVTTASALGFFVIMFGLSLLLAMVALLIAAKILIGGFGPIGLAVLRLASALAVFDVVLLLLGGGWHFTVFPGLVATIILAGMIVWLFDFDLTEGALVAIIICVLKLALVIGKFFLL